jgi:hypothetical protein
MPDRVKTLTWFAVAYAALVALWLLCRRKV